MDNKIYENSESNKTIKFGLLNTSKSLESPKYSHDGDDGMDLRACYDSYYSHELTRYIKLYSKEYPNGIDIDTWDENDPNLVRESGLVYFTLNPGDRARIPTGLFVNLPKGTRIHVSPRSGWSIKHGITVLNSPGKIDQSYHQCVNIILINHGHNPVVITHGERIAQWSVEYSTVGVYDSYESMDDYMNSISDCYDRGGGFGSSGTK